MVAQLKGFKFVSGNSIFMKICRHIFKPMVTAKRLPVDQSVKYALAFGIIMAGTMGIREIRDFSVDIILMNLIIMLMIEFTSK